MRRTWNLDVDRVVNRIVPPPPWSKTPYPIARFLGYRKSKPQDLGNVMMIFWAFIGIFCAVAVIEVVSMHVPSFEDRGVPIIVGSFGAAAVLEFYSIEAPLAQPRNAILGQIFSALVGVSICRLFQLSDDFESIRWLGGALACATATAVMGITKTIHPPAGATALLAVVDNDLVKLGWFLVPVIMLGCGLMLAVALLINNIERRFPVYWWTPENLGTKEPVLKTEGEHEKEEETKDLEANEGNSSRDERRVEEVIIRAGEVIVPDHMLLTPEERQLLESMSKRI